MKNKPIVTVVIPVFNNQDTICETLDSVCAQTLKDWEVICVDDGSIDNSVAVIKDFAQNHKDFRIRLMKRETENKGGSVCRNIGARCAEGEYLVFLDADDLLSDTCLEKRVEAIESTADQFVVFPMAAFVNNDIKTAKNYSRLYVKQPLYFFASGFGTWQVTSPLFKKSFFDKIGGFDESFPRLQDVEFHLRAIVESENHYSIYKDVPADCYYRQGGSTEVRVEKLKRTIIGCKKLISLISYYTEQDVFKDKKKFSQALLSLYFHISIYQDNIIIHEPEFIRTNPIITSELKKHIRVFGRFLMRVIDSIPNANNRIFLCRVFDKIVRSKLVK